MIKRLSTFITKTKDFCYSRTFVYALCVGACAAALLLAYAFGDGESVAFVYNEF